MTDFIVVGNMNACTYKEVFPMFKSGKVRLGYVANKPLLCKLPEGSEDEYAKVNSVSWFVTFPVEREPIVLSKTYNPEDYPKYDNYDAINVDRVEDIPYDYDGVMGVPVSFLAKCGGGFVIEDKLNSPVIGGAENLQTSDGKKKLEIVGMAAGARDITGIPFIDTVAPIIGGGYKYARVFIRLNNNNILKDDKQK